MKKAAETPCCTCPFTVQLLCTSIKRQVFKLKCIALALQFVGRGVAFESCVALKAPVKQAVKVEGRWGAMRRTETSQTTAITRCQRGSLAPPAQLLATHSAQVSPANNNASKGKTNDAVFRRRFGYSKATGLPKSHSTY